MILCAADHTVLVKANVSLTYETLEDCSEHWWLTWENGQGPICWWQEPQSLQRLCGGSDSHIPPKAYLVVKAGAGPSGAIAAGRWKHVVFGELNLETLNATLSRIIPWLRNLPSAAQDCKGRGISIQGFYRSLDAGLYSLTSHCTCTDTGVCGGCREAHLSASRFVAQHQFQGPYPRGPLHWFSGVSAAVGDVAHRQLPWLRCCCGGNLQPCTVL